MMILDAVREETRNYSSTFKFNKFYKMVAMVFSPTTDLLKVWSFSILQKVCPITYSKILCPTQKYPSSYLPTFFFDYSSMPTSSLI
jgi:hypothetical protein